MGDLFVKSIYTTYVLDDQKHLIVYNSMIGSSSIMKFDVNASLKILPLLDSNIAFDQDKYSIPSWNKLVAKNIFVNIEKDEEKIAENLMYDIVGSSTLNLCILPTGQCNYRCKYCYENFKLGRMPIEIQDGIVKFVRKNIHYFSGLNVSWFGGEPLLAPDIIDYISGKLMTLCNVSKRSYCASITSNGYLLDDVMLERLINNKIYKIQISLDGLKATNDYNKPLVNGGGTFDKIVDNIRKIKSNVKTRLFHIAIRTNFTQESMKELYDYLSFMEKIIGDDSRFSLFLRSVNDLGGDSIEEMSSELLDKDESEDLYSMAASYKHRLYYTQHEMCLEPGGLVCYAGKPNDYLIQSDGTISKCSCALYSQVNKIGNVKNTGTFDIDSNKHSKWIRNTVLCDDCKKCSIMPLCFNLVCPAAFIDEKNEKTRKCPIEKDIIKDMLIMLSKTKSIERQVK